MKTTFITGAASGIGLAVAKHLAKGGHRVCLADIDSPQLQIAARDIEPACSVTLDVADEVSWQQAIEEVSASVGTIDAMVHAAGISAAGTIDETSLDEWRRVHAVNLDGAFLATKYGAAMMNEAGGAIIHIASASGMRPTAGAAAYCSSKSAVRMLARVAALELKPRGIRVNCICPAGVRTPMWESMALFQEAAARLGSIDAAYAEMEAEGGSRFAEAQDIAAAVAYLLSHAARLMTGAELVIDDGFTLGG